MGGNTKIDKTARPWTLRVGTVMESGITDECVEPSPGIRTCFHGFGSQDFGRPKRNAVNAIEEGYTSPDEQDGNNFVNTISDDQGHVLWFKVGRGHNGDDDRFSVET